MADEKRLRWQCRRGMLELDYILECFVDQNYPHLSTEQQYAFEKLLMNADPQLHGWLLEDITPPAEFRVVVDMIRNHPNYTRTNT